MDRAAVLARLGSGEAWDLVVIGGGATGLGTARRRRGAGLPTCAPRGRRLRAGDLEPQHEAGPRRRALPGPGRRPPGPRGPARARAAAPNAPHLVHAGDFVVPAYPLVGRPVLRRRPEGLRPARRPSTSFGRSRLVGRGRGARRSRRRSEPTASAAGSSTSDGQFDDARLADRPGADRRGSGRGRAQLRDGRRARRRDGRRLAGVLVRDAETGEELDDRGARRHQRDRRLRRRDPPARRPGGRRR